jgi:hypothetical protein
MVAPCAMIQIKLLLARARLVAIIGSAATRALSFALASCVCGSADALG